MSVRALYEGFLRAAESHPERPALELGAERITYAELSERARSIATTIAAHASDAGPPLTAVLGQRTVAGFAAILGASCAGHGYVPMLPTHPAPRLAAMLERSRARTLVVDAGGMPVLPELLERVATPMTVLVLEDHLDATLRRRCARHVLLAPDDLRSASSWAAPTVHADDIAYLLFTSGSTGLPKGVMVAHRNIAHFVDVAVDRYAIGPDDRFSHMFEVTFDLSLFDMFVAWQAGACLCCPDARQRLLPARWVADAGLTVWFSVPSTARLMKDARTLVDNAFPSLRWSLFCGEALPVPLADAWARAAPHSIVENLYGPTELTLACTVYRHGPRTASQATGDIVPIGAPLPGMRAQVVDAELRAVRPGESGELVVTGPQVALGYWDDPERTSAAFVVPPGESEVYYRTGDLVVRPTAPGDPLLFGGRLDQQIKIRGYRVELGEIEAVIRREAGTETAVALGWPESHQGGAEAVVAFVADSSIDVDDVLRRAAEHLPRYMVPRELRVIDEFPLNANGKIDRNALRAILRRAPGV
jgi:amino acid adenylation domain-containing protein